VAGINNLLHRRLLFLQRDKPAVVEVFPE
jgi:hypothetical protein